MIHGKKSCFTQIGNTVSLKSLTHVIKVIIQFYYYTILMRHTVLLKRELLFMFWGSILVISYGDPLHYTPHNFFFSYKYCKSWNYENGIYDSTQLGIYSHDVKQAVFS